MFLQLGSNLSDGLLGRGSVKQTVTRNDQELVLFWVQGPLSDLRHRDDERTYFILVLPFGGQVLALEVTERSGDGQTTQNSSKHNIPSISLDSLLFVFSSCYFVVF